jgi:Outer membrane protein beta-barrel domain
MRARVSVAAFIAAIGCVGIAGPANAQMLAVKAGVSVSNITQNATFKPDDELFEGGGFMMGVQIRRAVNRVLQVQIEGLLTQKGNAIRNGHKAPDLDDEIVINYVEVPVLARVGVFQWGRTTISIHGGPTFAFIASSTETNNGHSVFSPLKLKTFDMGLAIGSQVELKRLIFGGRYTMGLSNIFADDPAVFSFSEMKNRALTFFAGYRLR